MPAKTVNELLDIERALNEACRELSYLPGSIFRIASQYLKNWGIEVTPENREWIELRSITSYEEEWERSTEASHEAIKRATKDAGLHEGNPKLNTYVGGTAGEILLSMDDEERSFNILDIGAGTGETTAALLDYMDIRGEKAKEIIRRSQLTLLDVSRDTLNEADRRIRAHIINESAKVKFRTVDDTHSFIDEIKEGNFDLVISSAVFHHMTFPTYLDSIKKGLGGDGVVVVGDWYTRIWEHPAFVAPVLRELGMSRDSLMQFEFMFGLGVNDRQRLEKGFEPHEIDANKSMVEYIIKLGHEFARVPQESRLFFLEGHEALGDRVRKLEDTGFVVDLKELREKHRGFVSMDNNVRRLYPKSDIAAVVACAKVPRAKQKRTR